MKFEEDASSDADGDELTDDAAIAVADRGKYDRRSAEKLWLISYSDFMTIMMIFFLAMFGYAFIMNSREEALRRPMAYKEFESVISEMKAKLGDQIRLLDDVGKMTVELGEGVLFQSGKADLSDVARQTLRQLAASISRVEGDVIVEGHTDDIPIVSRHFQSNWELSAARAFSVVEELSNGGVPEKRLAAWGFGENRPVVPNSDLENRQRNRRISIVVLKKVAVLEKTDATEEKTEGV